MGELFYPLRLIMQLAFTDDRTDAADFGCGHGTFDLASAPLTAGTVYSLDIDPEMVKTIASRVASFGLHNIQALRRDIVSDGTGLPDTPVDYVMMFNILHAREPVELVDEAHRILRGEGRLAVVHWIYSTATPLGPDLGIRPRPIQCQD